MNMRSGRSIATTLVLAWACACGDDTSTTADDAPAGDATPTDVGDDIDAAVPDGAPGIEVGPACGTTTCVNGSQECCLGMITKCVAIDTCPSREFRCDGPEDCPGGACCFGNTVGSECRTTNCQEVACHGDGDCPGAKCCPKTFTPDYKVCQPQC